MIPRTVVALVVTFGFAGVASAQTVSFSAGPNWPPAPLPGTVTGTMAWSVPANLRPVSVGAQLVRVTIDPVTGQRNEKVLNGLSLLMPPQNGNTNFAFYMSARQVYCVRLTLQTIDAATGTPQPEVIVRSADVQYP